MIKITIHLEKFGGQQIEPTQVEKFVEESLHRFQAMTKPNLAEHISFLSFCESESEKTNMSHHRSASVDERVTSQNGKLTLYGYNDLPMHCNQFQTHKKQKIHNNKNLPSV